jgi:hypothetical protein
MIGWLLRFLFGNPWGVVILGLLTAGVGGILISASQEQLPERAALNRAEGMLDGATKITRGRSRTVTYELEVKSANGAIVKLTLPEREISEDQVKRLLGRPLVAMYSGEKDVWELSSGPTKIITYDQTRERRLETQAFEAAAGPYVGAGGLVVSLVGLAWGLRRRRTAVTA